MNNRYLKEPETKPQVTFIKIFKAARKLELYGDNKLIAVFKIALGKDPQGEKQQEGDNKTPEGTYYVCTRNEKSKFTLFLGLSYPNIEDANRGLDKGIIDKEIYNTIKSAQGKEIRPPWNTPVGGEVGIHGGGIENDWTAGCIALSDEDIKILWDYTPLKTMVKIYSN